MQKQSARSIRHAQEIIEGTRYGRRLLASHYPYCGDTQDTDRHTAHRPVDRGIPLIHGHVHAHDRGRDDHQFHVGVDAFEYAPIRFERIDEWLRRL